MIFKLVLTIILWMHPQTPEKPTQSLVDSFLQYPEHTKKMRKQLLIPKTPEQLKNTTAKMIQTQYQLLNAADIDQNIFNFNYLWANRYSDIFAYEHSRVKISEVQNYYINGNQIISLVDNKPFAIFSQAPYKNFQSFWEGVYYKNVNKIIMLCKFYDPNRGYQSEQYWPNKDEQTVISKNLKVSTISSKMHDEQFTESIFKIEGPKGEKIVTHYHWTGWSDLKRPLQHTLDKFQFLIDMCTKEIESEKLVWIHCSAGIGRTGTLGGVIDGLRFFKKYKKLSIFAIVENMRKYRYHAVQTFDQYQFLYSYLSKKL